MGDDADEGITFKATLYKVQTLADGSPRWTLDGLESEIRQAALSMGLHKVLLEVTLKVYHEESQNVTEEESDPRPNY